MCCVWTQEGMVSARENAKWIGDLIEAEKVLLNQTELGFIQIFAFPFVCMDGIE